MTLLSKAIHFASEKHVGQVDKGGNAYILHPLRIMMRLRTQDEELMSIAILHDVVEDCGVSFDDLRELGMTERVLLGVKALTRQAGETYTQFIERLADNTDALLVKREDLRDNSDLTRLKGVTDKDVSRMQKYMHAFKRIEFLLQQRNYHSSKAI
jgi:GTP diphosphokinase / guanosine-3',5'-bis(diphosphate) 3'-diphosphatase